MCVCVCTPDLPRQGQGIIPGPGMIPVGREVRDGTQDRTPDWEASGPKFQHDMYVVVGPSRVESSLSLLERASKQAGRLRVACEEG